jgi:hypothetical protein
VAEMILYMNKNVNGSGYPPGPVSGDQIPLGSRILRVVFDFQDLEIQKSSFPEMIAHMRGRTIWYDSKVLDALEQVVSNEPSHLKSPERPRILPLKDLRAGHMLHRGIFTVDGLLVVPEGTVLRPSNLEKMRNFARLSGLQEPIWVIGPDPE